MNRHLVHIYAFKESKEDPAQLYAENDGEGLIRRTLSKTPLHQITRDTYFFW